MAGDRVIFAGAQGAPDSVEQPFASLDMNVDYYPFESTRVRFKAQNLLDEKIEYKQGDTTIVEQTVGVSYSLSFKYSY